MSNEKTAIVTGARQGIGAGLVEGFLKAGYNVVTTSLRATSSLTASPTLVFVDGDIGRQETALKTVEAATKELDVADECPTPEQAFAEAETPLLGTSGDIASSRELAIRRFTPRIAGPQGRGNRSTPRSDGLRRQGPHIPREASSATTPQTKIQSGPW
jgi:NAD(P)-dependent dehydrogenase (short-subunit alcohol dehydrogenase family)